MFELSHFLPQGLPPQLEVLMGLLPILQITLLMHAHRTGRPSWWLIVLFLLPLVGVSAYLITLILPNSRTTSDFLYSLKPRSLKIRDLRSELDECETVENRLALAEELFAAGNISEAHDVAVGCLKGVFKDDPHTMADVVRFKLALNQYQEAYALAEKIDVKPDAILARRVEFLKKDCLAGLSRERGVG